MATVMYKDLEGITRVFGGDGEEPEQTFDPLSEKAMSGKAIAEIAPFRLGVDEYGRYGYYKDGADTVTPFKQGEDTPAWERPAEWPNLDLLPFDEQVIYITLDNTHRDAILGLDYVASPKAYTIEVGQIVDGEFLVIDTINTSVSAWRPSYEYFPSFNIDYLVLRIKAAGQFTSLMNIAPYLSDGTTAPSRYNTSILEIYVNAPSATRLGTITGYITQHVKIKDCVSLTSIDSICSNARALELFEIENCDTTKITSYYNAFNSCTVLENVDFLKDLDFISCTTVSGMFSVCRCLKSLDLTVMKNTGNISNWKNFLANSSGIKEVNMAGMDLHSATDFGAFFQYTYGLQKIDMSGCNISNVTAASNFTSASGVTDFKLPDGINFSFTLNYITTRKDIIDIFNQLPTVSGLTLTIGSSALKVITDADKAIATDRGWTLA